MTMISTHLSIFLSIIFLVKVFHNSIHESVASGYCTKVSLSPMHMSKGPHLFSFIGLGQFFPMSKESINSRSSILYSILYTIIILYGPNSLCCILFLFFRGLPLFFNLILQTF